MEIERKFVPSALPEDLDSFPRVHMVQGYLNTAPVVRVRKENDDCYLTYKGGGMMVREEYNLPLTREAFARPLPIFCPSATAGSSRRPGTASRWKDGLSSRRSLISSPGTLRDW